jgi:two-component system nitrogen regulation sensor histidine kinase NtrY
VSDWRRQWLRYRRQNRVLIALYTLLMALAGGGYALFHRMVKLPPEELTNRLLTFLFWWFDLTLIAILVFILARSLIKLALERHYGMLGSRFRTKLLLSYVVLILVPTSVLFLLSVSLLSQAATSWFSAPVDGMASAGVQLAGGVREAAEQRVKRAADVVAHAVSGAQTEQAKVAELERLHGLLGNHLTGLLRRGIPVVELVDARQRTLQQLPSLEEKLLETAGVRSERFGGTLVVRAWVSAGSDIVVVGEALPADLIKAQGRLAVAGAAYERLKLDRPTITATMVLGFGGLALVVAFAAIWLGLYLARRFTAPLLALAATTERIAEGENLEEVPLPAEDEVGMLVGSFNSMVRRVRQREDELRSAVERLDTVLGAVRTGVLSLDAGRNTVVANPAAAAMLGVPALAIEGLPVNELESAGLERLVETIRKAQGAVRGSMTIYPQGLARNLEVAVVPLGTAESPTGWVVALEDMTQLLRAQRQAAWSEVARRIAHQIKNPWTPIRLAAERIARKFERGSHDLNDVVPQGCAAIVEHVSSMQEMVDSFSRFAKLPPMNRRPVRLAEVASQVVALYQGVRHGLDVKLHDGSQGRDVMLDAEQFRQVLMNLIDNAIEASPDGGRITVSLGWDEGEAVVVVADEGVGLTIDDQEMLFQPFFSTKGRGSGVGLAVVQRVVTDHGGTVRLEPNEVRGVRAVIRLPGELS